ncbi:hypothetical protein HDU76_013006 [Blyttiomyces sp. JEL0837]|nr:hypothetical protein HDU76_013006 [Blyttiomyces sp. JEL0837]
MPKSNIETAIKKGVTAAHRGTGNTAGDEHEPVTYEGLSSEGVSVIVQALTDKRTRTFAEVRHIFKELGGGLTPVLYLFDKKGRILFGVHKHQYGNINNNKEEVVMQKDIDFVMDLIIDVDGVEDFGTVGGDIEGDTSASHIHGGGHSGHGGHGNSHETLIEVLCKPEDVLKVQRGIIEKVKESGNTAGIELDVKELDVMAYVPNSDRVKLDGEQSSSFEKLLSELENQEDVVKIFHNAA